MANPFVAFLLAAIISSCGSVAYAKGDIRGAPSVDAARARALLLLSQPRFQAPNGWHWGAFRNADNAALRYGWCDASGALQGTIILLPGFQSPIESFFEAARDFQAQGFAVWIFDWRGQGGSDRWLPDSQKTYSRGFERDERDLVQFVQKIVPHASASLFFAGESFGGQIGLRVLHDYPGLVRAAAFSSPAIAFQTGNTPSWLIRLVSSIATVAGMGTDYAQNQSDWTFDPEAGGPNDPVSDDRDRALASEAWYLKYPQLRQGGATWAYVNAFYASSDVETSPGWMSTIQTPVLFGMVPDDKIAVASLMSASCREMKKCTLVKFFRTKHALFGDRDAVRTPFVAAIVRFFVSYGSRRPVRDLEGL